jgi:aminomethyltransferase
MVDFAGWSMPVQYSSIIEEHNATRNAVGVFDISHMGRLQFSGPQVASFIDSVATRRVIDLQPNQIRYSLICNEEGGILDDVLIYGGTTDEALPYTMVVNASNRSKIVNWLQNRAASAQIKIEDRTTQTAMIAVQGPKAADLMQGLLETAAPISQMRYYSAAAGYWENEQLTVSRTGYTGEDGIEVICNADLASELWASIVDHAAVVGGMACGLGARDTLRLEAAMPLYGHELSETINPIQAGLKFAMNLENRKFIGSKALDRIAADNSQPVRVGLELDGKRVAREGCTVLQGSQAIGEVTSGTFSPTLQRSLAMAYIKPVAQTVGTQLTVEIRGTQHPAVVVPLPFYKRKK